MEERATLIWFFFFNDMHWCLRSELLKLKSVCDSLGNLVKTDSDSVDLQWGLRHSISKKLPEDAAGSRTRVWVTNPEVAFIIEPRSDSTQIIECVCVLVENVYIRPYIRQQWKAGPLCTVNTSPVPNQYRFKSRSPIVALKRARQDSIIVPCVWCLALCREKHLSPVSCSCSAALGQRSSLALRAKRITHAIFDPGWIWLPSNASLGRASGFRCDPPMFCFLAFL